MRLAEKKSKAADYYRKAADFAKSNPDFDVQMVKVVSIRGSSYEKSNEKEKGYDRRIRIKSKENTFLYKK